MKQHFQWLRTVGFVVRKEFRQVFRDKGMLRIIFAAPLIQLIFLSYAATTDLKNLRLAILDEDHTPQSREFSQSFFQNNVFKPAGHAGGVRELRDILQSGRADIIVHIPRGFAGQIAQGRSTDLGITVDGGNSSAAGRALGYAQAVVQQQILRTMEQYELSRPGRLPNQVETVTRFLYNPELESRPYMVPAILVMLITVVSGFLTGMALVREKEIGTLEQLMVTPLTSAQIITGKLIPFAVISFVEFAFAGTVAILWFNIPLQGSILLLALCVMVYLLVTMGGGLLASTVSHTQQQAMFTVWFFIIFGIMTSGFFYPIENMPDWIQTITYANPMRYFMAIIRGIFLKGSGFTDVLPNLLPMAAIGILTFTVAIARFRQRLA